MQSNNVKNVLIIAGKINTSNGAFHSLYANIKEFKKMGIRPVVVLSKNDDVSKKIQQLGVKIYLIPYNSCTVPVIDNFFKKKIKGFLKQSINNIYEKKINRIIKYENIDLLYVNVSTCSFGVCSAIRNNIPVVWHIREFLEEDVNMTYYNPKATKKMLLSATRIIAITNSVAEHFKNKYNLENIKVIYNGVFDNQNIFNNNKNDKNELTTFTIIGRIINEKGQLEALEAFYKLNKLKKNVELNIVGKIGSEKYYESLVEFVEKHKLIDKVHFISHTTDLRQIWENTDIGLICSKKEGFGRVTAEFMINKIPVIGANTGGTCELLSEDRGILYNQGDTTDLQRKMQYCIENKNTIEKCVENAYRYAKDNFSTYICAKKIVDVFASTNNKK